MSAKITWRTAFRLGLRAAVATANAKGNSPIPIEMVSQGRNSEPWGERGGSADQDDAGDRAEPGVGGEGSGEDVGRHGAPFTAPSINLLLLAAGYAPAFNETPLDDLEHIAGVLDFMLDAHEPNMAIVIDRQWNLIRPNRAATVFTSNPHDRTLRELREEVRSYPTVDTLPQRILEPGASDLLVPATYLVDGEEVLCSRRSPPSVTPTI